MAKKANKKTPDPFDPPEAEDAGSKQLDQAVAASTEECNDGVTGAVVLTGLIDLDEVIGGFRDSELVVIGGRPNSGKSALAFTIILHTAVEAKRPVLVVSLKQPRSDLRNRLLCCQARVDYHKFLKEHISAEEMQRILEAHEALPDAALFIDDSPRQGVSCIAATAARLKVEMGIALIVIDSVQLVDSERRYDARHEEVGHVVRELKILAREIRTPVVVLAGINRSCEDRTDRRPRLSDLRETGSLEELADIVLLLNPPDQREQWDSDGTMEVIAAKRRGGPTAEIHLALKKEYCRIANWEVDNPFAS